MLANTGESGYYSKTRKQYQKELDKWDPLI